MARLIDADAFIAEYCENCGGRCDLEDECCDTVDMLMNAPTVDAKPVVHGRWIEKVDMIESYFADCTEVFYECSVCECANIGESPYCPNCGADMRERSEGE